MHVEEEIASLSHKVTGRTCASAVRLTTSTRAFGLLPRPAATLRLVYQGPEIELAVAIALETFPKQCAQPPGGENQNASPVTSQFLPKTLVR